MAHETRIIGGFEVEKPTSVMGLERIKKTLMERGVDEALREIDREIENRWVMDGYWRNVSLVPVFD